MAIDGSARFWNADGQRRPVAEGFEGERISSAETDRTASAVPNDETPFGRSEASVDDAETESVGDVPRNTGEKGAIVQHQTVASNGRDDGSAGGQRCCQSVTRRKSCPPPKKKQPTRRTEKRKQKRSHEKKTESIIGQSRFDGATRRNGNNVRGYVEVTGLQGTVSEGL